MAAAPMSTFPDSIAINSKPETYSLSARPFGNLYTPSGEQNMFVLQNPEESNRIGKRNDHKLSASAADMFRRAIVFLADWAPTRMISASL